MSVYFHGSFGLNRPRMAKLLDMLIEGPEIGDRELAAHFNYGAPFAAKYRSWLHKVGFIEQHGPFMLTELGRRVRDTDPALKSSATVLTMHRELTSSPEKAETWHFFAHDFRERHQEFTRDVLESELSNKLSHHSKMHFGPGSKMVPVIAKKIIECYCLDDALGPLALIEARSNGVFQFQGTK